MDVLIRCSVFHREVDPELCFRVQRTFIDTKIKVNTDVQLVLLKPYKYYC